MKHTIIGDDRRMHDRLLDANYNCIFISNLFQIMTEDRASNTGRDYDVVMVGYPERR